MKKVLVAIAISLVIITGCIIYLVRHGISLRAAPIIQPSVMDEDQVNVAKALSVRLFQELQNSRYVIWGVLPETAETMQILSKAAEEYEKVFHKPVQFIRDAELASQEYLKACGQPCWLTVSGSKANQLEANSFIQNNILPLAEPFITITLLPFDPSQTVPEECESQKRLTLKCFAPVSIRSVKRKMKIPQNRYFFLNKYYDNDFFLFIQNKS